MELPTYQLAINDYSLAFDDSLCENLKKKLNIKISEKDYFCRKEIVAEFNNSLSLTIVVLKPSLEEALPICNQISKILEENNFKFRCLKTSLLWDENNFIHFNLKH